MSDTKWVPDENGEPTCGLTDCLFFAWVKDNGENFPSCTHPLSSMVDAGDYCYPQMVKRSEALNAFMEWNSGPDAGMENSQAMWNEAVAKIIDAVTP